jgi:hypothetical protein
VKEQAAATMRKEPLMLIPLPELEQMPGSVRNAVLLTFMGWGCFLFSTYAFYDPNSFLKFAVAGGILCYYLYKSRRWARVMAMLASIFIVLYGGFFAFLFAGQNTPAMLLSVANVALFAASFYCLVLPETNRYFKKNVAPDENPEGGKPTPPAQGDA